MTAAITGFAAPTALTLAYGTRAAIPYGAVPALASAALLLWAVACRPRSRARLARPLTLVGCLSLMTTVTSDPPSTPWGAVWRPAEMAVLLMLLAVVARWAPRRQAVTAGVVAGLAVATWTVPLVPAPSLLPLAGAVAFWTLPVLGAAVVGGYPRLVENRRRRLVVETRRSQQLELARDLHDFVAHDISGIVAQAQAARFVAAADPGQALPALERIERAGLNALASMDRTVRMLHEAQGNGITRTDAPGPAAAPAAQEAPTPKSPPPDPSPRPEPLPGVDQLPALIERFTSAGATEARLAMPSATPGTLSRETSSTAYRMVVEALTNVRRHAPGAARVEVTLTPVVRSLAAHPVPAVEIQVANDAGTAATTALRARRERDGHGGRGLTALRARVQATGGTLSYGPHGGGWRVLAVFPQTRTFPQETA
ncbi:histidine kinase [Streptomyces sp. NPDC048637]|uniref:sensor histidine kinase n=1 Tax=Streptomyces sp. NPDC048637 TaxID=3155636 RepID=UPI00341DF395